MDDAGTGLSDPGLSDPGDVWLVRHGETEWSRDGRHTSTTDLPLTDVGRRVAAGLRGRLEGLEFSLVLTSPRERARETARLAGYADAEVDDDLAEWSYGELEGLTSVQIQQTHPGWTIWDGPWPGGETPADVRERFDRVVARCRAVDGPVLLFSHGHALRVLAERWLDQPVEEGRHLYLDTATVSVLGDDRGTPVVKRWNS